MLETRSNPVNYNIQLIVLVYNTTQYIAMQCIQWRAIQYIQSKEILWNLMTSTSFVFTELGEGSYITLFSPSDVTAFYRIKYGGGGVI